MRKKPKMTVDGLKILDWNIDAKQIFDSKIRLVHIPFRMIDVENCRGVGAAAKLLTSQVSNKFAEELFILLQH